MTLHVGGRALEDFDALPEYATWVARQAGLSAEHDRRQVWRVGGYELGVSFWQDERVYTVLGVHTGWPRKPATRVPKALALAQVFALAVSQELHLPDGPNLAAWKARALIESGVVESPHVR